MGRKKIIPYSEMEYVRVVLTQSNTLALPAPDSTKSDKYLVIGKKSPMHNSHYYVETYGHKTRYTYFKKRVKNMFARNELAIKMNYFPFQIEDIINKINMKREVAWM